MNLIYLINWICLFRPINTETSEHVITENILNQYAQKLLRGVQVHVLATFAAHLEFNLEEWLAKERLVDV